MDQEAQAEKAAAREARRQEAADYQAIEAQLDQVEAAAGDLIKAALLLAGYHPHRRQWRRNYGGSSHNNGK